VSLCVAPLQLANSGETGMDFDPKTISHNLNLVIQLSGTFTINVHSTQQVLVTVLRDVSLYGVLFCEAIAWPFVLIKQGKISELHRQQHHGSIPTP
jgi:hypothetical protein